MSATLDWQQAHLRLERARRLVEAGGQRPPEEARRILEARARQLARPGPEPAEALDTIDLLVWTLSDERFGLDVTQVLDVAVAPALTPVPCTPAFVRGVVSHRGRILSVVDVRLLLDPAAEARHGGLVIAVQAQGAQFGLAADEVAGVVRAAADDVVRGVTAQLVSVLDIEALVRHPRFEVNDGPV